MPTITLEYGKIAAKNQLIWFGTRQQLLKLDFALLAKTFPSFTFSSSVRNLGVVLDSTLIFSEHIKTLTRSCYFQVPPETSQNNSTFCLLLGLYVYMYSPCLYLLPC